MTLLSICTSLAKNVGLQIPDVIATSPAREWKEAMEMANNAGAEMIRRVDWGALQASATLTGDGTAKIHSLPADFSRLNSGVCVRSGAAIVRPLTRPEWNTLTMVQGTPRYFLLERNTLMLWPYLADLATVTIEYQSKNWTSSGPEFLGDTDTALIDEGILAKAVEVRWRRQKGMDYADHEAEYEAALADVARFDDRSRL